ncbi:MAG: response regulator [Bacteroidota bacterium]
MENHALNVYILNDNVEIAGKLRKYLRDRFGKLLNISLFFSSRSCLKMMDNHVDLVVVDDYLYEGANHGTPGVDVLKKIKEKNPKTEVVILTSNEDIGMAVDAMKMGARDYIINNRGAWQRILAIIDRRIHQPIRYLVAEYGVAVFVTAFFVTFTLVGVAVYFALRYMV